MKKKIFYGLSMNVCPFFALLASILCWSALEAGNVRGAKILICVAIILLAFRLVIKACKSSFIK